MFMNRKSLINGVIFFSLIFPWNLFLIRKIDIFYVDIFYVDEKPSSLSHLLHHHGGVRDVLCSGCRLAQVKGSSRRCGNLIQKTMKVSSTNSNTSSLPMVDAARQVALKHPECYRCDPSSCNEAQKYYWRADEPFSNDHLHQAQTPLLRTIPNQHRFPSSISPSNFSNFIAHRQNLTPSEMKSTFYWEYNPSIAILPKDQIPHGTKLSLNQSDYYLMAVRVSDHSNCFTSEQNDQLHQEWKRDFLGLAVLDANLNILLETVVRRENIADHRVFNLKGRLYLGFVDSFKALWINPPPNAEKLQKLEARFSVNLHADHDVFNVYVSNTVYCCISGHCQGKNMNYFLDDQERVLVESYPSNPHIVELVDTSNSCNRSGMQLRKLLDTESDKQFINKYYSLSRQENATVYITEDLPRESFGTTDEIHFADHGIFVLPNTEDRGTACCIRINDPRQPGKELFVGVSHTKIPFWLAYLMDGQPGLDFGVVQYTSRLYAFETIPPYRLVALSGQFCLGFALGEEERKENYNNVWIEQRPYRLNRTNHACPKITFISALSESVDNPSQAIIGYGMNDCAVRIAKVDKGHLVRLLFMENYDSLVSDPESPTKQSNFDAYADKSTKRAK
jgi:hypothetical protein